MYGIPYGDMAIMKRLNESMEKIVAIQIPKFRPLYDIVLRNAVNGIINLRPINTRNV